MRCTLDPTLVESRVLVPCIGTRTAGGFLFMTDDVLVNLGQLSRFAREDSCGKIWQSLPILCTDILSK